MVAGRIVRRSVPNDHGCLFSAAAYLAEGHFRGGVVASLRKTCAEAVRDDPERYTEVHLGMENTAYQKWIQDPFSWGGETEIVILASFYSLEIAVVTMQSQAVLVYSSQSKCKGRIYLLYTGQHYDPLVGVADAETPTAEEHRVFSAGDQASQQLAVACAAEEQVQAELRARQRVRKVLKCAGCGALLDTNEAFQQHCAEVDHNDEFTYMCDEVEVVEDITGAGDLLPEGAITFYNTNAAPLSNSYPSPICMEEKEFPTVDHYLQASKFLGIDPTAVEQIRCAGSVAAALELGLAAEGLTQQWEDRREGIALQAIREKFTAHPDLRLHAAVHPSQHGVPSWPPIAPQ
eukprot:GGOE01020738.1.p1 GENE.GGOE01020738.1~~GGOE01020738.1.p1  ORF type:complete len:357 (-),score=105.94 GGOE01020738.1:295-1335(-)